MLDKVSQRVVDAVYSRLSASNGFNAGMAAQTLVYGLPPDFFIIDWSETSQNFYFDQIDTELLEKSGTIKYPFASLYIYETIQTNDQKFTQFSGVVRCIFEVNLSWTPIRGTQNREAFSSCVEDVVFDVINRVDNQNWGKPLVYNGLIQCKRGPTAFGAQNFKKKLAFLMTFGVHQ